MRFLTVLALLFFGLLPLAHGQTKEPKTIDEWNQHIQELRGKAFTLWGPEDSSPENLQKGMEAVKQVLAILHSPKLAKLRKEDFMLRMQDQDVYTCMVIISAKQKDAKNAIQHMNTLLDFYSKAKGEGNAGFEAHYLQQWEPVLKMLEASPEFRAAFNKLRQLDPSWGMMYRDPPFSLEYRETLPVEERIAGLSTLWSEVKFNFAYFDRTSLDWNKALADTLPQVIAAERTFEYYQVLQRLIARLGDAHTNVFLPSQISRSMFGGWPPVFTEAIDGRVYVRRIASKTVEDLGISRGDEVLTIDGVPVKQYAETNIRPYESSSTPQDLAVRMYDYRLLDGPLEKPVVLGIQKPDGSRKEVTVNRSRYPDFAPITSYAFSVRDGIGIVRINNFETWKYLTQLKADLVANPKLKGLVIDLRSNGGGDSSLSQYLISGLIDKPIKMKGSQGRAYSALSRGWQRPLGWEQLPDWEIKPAKDWKFRGPVNILIGPKTFSAAEDFVSMFISAKRGLLIGQTTGGSTGNPFSFPLPGGGSARVCVKRDYLADGTSFIGTGIKPNVEVTTTPENLRLDQDPVLAAAIFGLKNSP